MRNWVSLFPILMVTACATQQTVTHTPAPSELPQETPKPELNIEVVEYEVVQDPKQEGISATCIYLGGELLGQTAAGLRSREKIWEGRLPPGNHLLKFQRWFFPGNHLWLKDNAAFQPRKRFIRVKEGSKTRVVLKYYAGGKKYSFQVSRKVLASATTEQFELVPEEKIISRLGFCPLSPEYDDSSFSHFWTKKRTIVVSNSAPALTDHQIEIKIPYDSDMSPDFRDLRFFDSQGNYLPTWIQSHAESQEATVLVRLPSIPPSGVTLTLYYGNPFASDLSNPKDTLLLYDDFETFEGWSVIEGTGTTSPIKENEVSAVEIQGEGSETVLYCKPIPTTGPLFIEARLKMLQPPFGLVFYDSSAQSKSSLLFNQGAYGSDLWQAAQGLQELGGPGLPTGGWETVTLIKQDSKLTILRSYAGGPIEEKTLQKSTDSLCLAIPGGNGKGSLDYVLVRKHAPGQLTVSLGEEKDRQLPE